MEEKNTDHAPRRRLAGVLVTLGLLCAVVAVLLVSHTVVIFRKGIYLKITEAVTLPLFPEETAKLNYFPGLIQADLRGSSADFREIVDWSRQHPQTTVWYTVPDAEVDGAKITYDEESGVADAESIRRASFPAACEQYLAYMREGTRVKCSFADWDVSEEALADQLDRCLSPCPEALVIEGEVPMDDWDLQTFLDTKERYPALTYTGTLMLDGVSCALDAETLDFSDAAATGFSELAEALPHFPAVTAVDFGTEEERHDKLEGVAAVAARYPEKEISYRFTAFGKTIDFHTETLDFNHIKMDDQGAEVREILACLPDVTFLDMDFCGVDDEHMAAIRDDFPDVKVVWRIWFGTNYSVRTDVVKILASAPQVGGMLTPETTKSLIYCTDLKYLDIGHNEGLRDLYFVRYMPNLEVLICMWGSITDISPLADCPHLEFLEIFTNNITDISPLAGLHELKHLNMCWNLGLKDMTPIYGLTQLERLWIGTTTGIPREQVEEFKKRVPDCEVNDWCGDPHTNWRWGTERYALLQEQFGYVNYEYEFYWRDPLYYPHPDTEDETE